MSRYSLFSCSAMSTCSRLMRNSLAMLQYVAEVCAMLQMFFSRIFILNFYSLQKRILTIDAKMAVSQTTWIYKPEVIPGWVGAIFFNLEPGPHAEGLNHCENMICTWNDSVFWDLNQEICISNKK